MQQPSLSLGYFLTIITFFFGLLIGLWFTGWFIGIGWTIGTTTLCGCPIGTNNLAGWGVIGCGIGCISGYTGAIGYTGWGCVLIWGWYIIGWIGV